MAAEQLTITAGKLTREDTIVVNENGAVIEKGLVIHGANPPVTVGDVLVSVNGEAFNTVEELTQVLVTASNSGKPFKLNINRPKHGAADAASISRVIVELVKKGGAHGIKVGSENDFVVVTEVAGDAAAAGIKVKDAIMYINGERMFNANDAQKLIDTSEKLIINIKRGGAQGKVEFEEKQMTLKIPFSAGDVLGLTLNKELVVTKIQAGSPSEEKFEINDRIYAINNIKFRDDVHVYKFLERCDDDLVVDVMRSVPKDPDANKASQNNLVLLSLAMNAFEPVGVRPDEKMLISKIQKDSHGEGKFELGDIIKSVDGINVKDRNYFFKLLEAATVKNRVEVVVERSATREAELEMHQLPPNIEKIIKRHAGFTYLIVNIKYIPKAGRTFGLNMANVTSHKIVVPDVSEKSVAGDYLKPLDHIIAINGTPVSDCNIAKKLIRDSRACFQAVIERPSTIDAHAAVRKEVEEYYKRVNKPVVPTNTDQMPPDVQEIVTALLRRREKGNVVPAHPSPMRKANRDKKNINFVDQHTETQIQSDVPPTKALRSLK